MSDTITQESFDSLASFWADSNHQLRWSSVFVLPVWLRTWWQEFGAGTLYLAGIKEGERLTGIAPLMVKGGQASFIGSCNVCDYLDFVVVPGRERVFFSALLDDLRQKGISHLDLGPLRPDSTVLTHLVGIARSRGHEVVSQPEDVSSELELPASWEEYLGALTTKQRHEVRRKLRRLSAAGTVDCHFIKDRTAVHEALDTFLKLFTESRKDKATFLTTQMESFFRSMADTMAEAGLLKLGILNLDATPVAMIMCFDYDDCLYLYNSSYDTRYESLSPGLLCKVLSIKGSIQEGKKRFDFLKGDEIYKHHLGGKEIPLYRCQITLK